MRNERYAMWLGRTLGAVVGVMLISDLLMDNNLSAFSRLIVIAIAGVVFLSVFIRQCMIAYKYEGVPIIPLAFRWVVAGFFGAMALLIGWLLLVAFVPELYTPARSAVIWLIFAEASIWFFFRWVTVGRPQLAGPGETGSSV